MQNFPKLDARHRCRRVCNAKRRLPQRRRDELQLADSGGDLLCDQLAQRLANVRIHKNNADTRWCRVTTPVGRRRTHCHRGKCSCCKHRLARHGNQRVDSPIDSAYELITQLRSVRRTVEIVRQRCRTFATRGVDTHSQDRAAHEQLCGARSEQLYHRGGGACDELQPIDALCRYLDPQPQLQ
jgi:hypothetical protein